MRGHRSAGLGLVEVLVALGVLTVVAAALLALQASSLRASRAARVTEQLAAAAEAEARLRTAVGGDGGPCLVAGRWPAVASCRVEARCVGAGCRVPLYAVTVAAQDGRALTVVGPGPREAVLAGVAPPPVGGAP